MIRVLGLEMGDHPGLSGWPSVITRHSANKPVLDGCHFVGSGLQLRNAVARSRKLLSIYCQKDWGTFSSYGDLDLASHHGKEEIDSPSASGEEQA